MNKSEHTGLHPHKPLPEQIGASAATAGKNRLATPHPPPDASK